MKLCACGCGLPLGKGRSKFATDKCCDTFHNKKRYNNQTHYHPCNSGKSEFCYARKTGLWKAPNRFIRTCPACRAVLKHYETYMEEAIMTNI